MSDPSVPLAARADDPAPAATLAPAALPGQGRWIATGAAVLAALAAAAFVLAWNTQQRIRTLEGELVKRQQDSGALAAEARLLAVQAQEGTRDASGKLALLEARVAESSMQSKIRFNLSTNRWIVLCAVKRTVRVELRWSVKGLSSR